MAEMPPANDNDDRAPMAYRSDDCGAVSGFHDRRPACDSTIIAVRYMMKTMADEARTSR
jgi:hypothetical protein